MLCDWMCIGIEQKKKGMRCADCNGGGASHTVSLDARRRLAGKISCEQRTEWCACTMQCSYKCTPASTHTLVGNTHTHTDAENTALRQLMENI